MKITRNSYYSKTWGDEVDPDIREVKSQTLYTLVMAFSIASSALVIGFNLFKHKLEEALTVFAALPLLLFIYALYYLSLLGALLYMLCSRSYSWKRRAIPLIIGVIVLAILYSLPLSSLLY